MGNFQMGHNAPQMFPLKNGGFKYFVMFVFPDVHLVDLV